MADVKRSESRQDWKKRESFGSALTQVGITGVLLAAVVFFVVQRGAKQREAEETVRTAKQTALRDNPADLNAALTALAPLIEDGAPEALALAADLQAELWRTHGVPGADAKAKALVGRAEEADARAEERYAAVATVLLAEGKPKEAEQYLEGLRQKGASSPKLWFTLAEAQSELGQLPLARQAYSLAIDKGWKSPRFLAGYGEALLDEGAVDAAVEVLEKGRGLNPEHQRIRLTLALARLYKGENVQQTAALLRELEANKSGLTPMLQGRLGAALAELATAEQRYDDAIRLATEAAAVSPGDYYAHFAKARALALAQRPGAVEAARAALAARRMTPVVYLEGARLLAAGGNLEAATTLLDEYEGAFRDVTLLAADGKAVSSLDRDDRYWLTRGELLKSKGRQKDALAAFDKAIAAKGLNAARAHHAKGALLLAMGQLDAALEELRHVTPEDGTGMLAEAYLTVGEALFAKKDFSTACQNYAFGLAKLRRAQAPKERLNGLLEDVSKKLISAKQPQMAKAWAEEARPLIQ